MHQKLSFREFDFSGIFNTINRFSKKIYQSSSAQPPLNCSHAFLYFVHTNMNNIVGRKVIFLVKKKIYKQETLA